MPGIEDLLREELQRVTDAVQREHLRPLRAPAPRPRWQLRLIPLAAAAAVIAVITVAALMTGLPSGRPAAPSSPASAAIPGFYLTGVFTKGSDGRPQTEAVIRDSASGRVTGQVRVLSNATPAILDVAAYPDDRSFLIGTTEWGASGREEYRFFRLRVSAGGQAGPLTELRSPALPGGYQVQGFAVSPDGKLLAISLLYNSPDGGTEWLGEMRVIDLATGKTRTWTAPVQDGHYFIPGPPSWADDDRMLAFTWQVSKNLTTSNTVMRGVKLLDTSAPGGNLMDSRQIVSGQAVPGTIQSALITPDGRYVIVAASREVPSGGGRGTVVGQISEVETASGKLARVLRTQTARYTSLTHFVLDGSTEVFSFDPAGRYALVQNMQFGWMDIGGRAPGRFTPLAGFPAGREVFLAAW